MEKNRLLQLILMMNCLLFAYGCGNNGDRDNVTDQAEEPIVSRAQEEANRKRDAATEVAKEVERKKDELISKALEHIRLAKEVSEEIKTGGFIQGGHLIATGGSNNSARRAIGKKLLDLEQLPELNDEYEQLKNLEKKQALLQREAEEADARIPEEEEVD
ncbi:MAG: hypothetical protein AAFP00_16880 [Bacteroidota bacterium]